MSEINKIDGKSDFVNRERNTNFSADHSDSLLTNLYKKEEEIRQAKEKGVGWKEIELLFNDIEEITQSINKPLSRYHLDDTIKPKISLKKGDLFPSKTSLEDTLSDNEAAIELITNWKQKIVFRTN